MRQQLIAGTAAAAVLTGVASAQAQDFGREGRFSIAAERMFGYFHHSSEVDPEGPPGDVDFSTNSIGLLGQARHNDDLSTFYTVPRVAFDYFVIDGLSIGGSLVFWNTSVEVEDNDVDHTAFVLAPRVGYAFMFADWAGIWPRGGLSFFTGGLDSAAGVGDFSVSGMSLDIEAPFVFVPAEHVAILAGPAFDVALVAGGEFERGPFGDLDHDTSLLHVGLYAGLGTWF